MHTFLYKYTRMLAYVKKMLYLCALFVYLLKI